jgi:hypothetical protein
MTKKADLDLSKEMMNLLADVREVFRSVLSNLPETDLALKTTVEATIKEISSVRMKVFESILDGESRAWTFPDKGTRQRIIKTVPKPSAAR